MSSKHRRRGRAAPPTRGSRRLLRIGVALGALMALGYGLWLDHEVGRRFEGRRWSVPARIYAQPLEIFPGKALTAGGLEQELRAGGYERKRRASRPGSYARNGATFDIHTRGFDFWDGREPARRVRLELAGGSVRALREEGRDGSRALALQRLEPALIGRIYPAHREDRVLVRLEEVPRALIAALLSAEDRTFFEHHGISLRAVLRATLANLRAGAIVQGGSTLTQQLAKSFFLDERRTWWRKINDALIALLLELRYEKTEILEAYLNEVYLGQDGARAVHGFGLAAQFHFGRELDDLNLSELATLVGLVRGPSYYNPRRHPRRALERRNLVLAQMAELGILDADQLARAQVAPLGVSARAVAGRHHAFVDLVRRQLRRDYRDEDLRSEGLRIFTTLSPRVQRAAEAILARRLQRLEERGPDAVGLEGAILVTAQQSGEVLAVVGGRDPRKAGFNRALDAVRPVGSLIKPAVYLTALEQPARYTLASPVLDEPVSIRAAQGRLWQPKNYDGVTHGRVPLYEALTQSYNLATVRLGMEVGLREVAGTLRRLGVERPVDAYPSLLLGAAELSPVEVAQMYQTLAGGGFRVPLRAIRAVTTDRGEPLARYPLSVEQAFEPAPVFLVVEALRGVMREGTARSAGARLGPDLVTAGKTGTTDDLRDSWFAGFGADLLAVVWVGHDDNSPTGLSGAGGALQVWADLMQVLRPRSLSRAAPEAVEWAWTDLATGRTTEAQCAGAIPVPYVRGSAPAPVLCAGRASVYASPGRDVPG